MASDTDLQNWQKTFEQYDPETLRVLITKEPGINPDYKKEALNYLRELKVKDEAREEARYQTIRYWTIAAAIAGGIAAATGIIALFR